MYQPAHSNGRLKFSLNSPNTLFGENNLCLEQKYEKYMYCNFSTILYLNLCYTTNSKKLLKLRLTCQNDMYLSGFEIYFLGLF